MPRAAPTFSRKDLDDLTDYAGRFGARGMAWIKIKEDEWQSPITKFFTEKEIDDMREALGCGTGRSDSFRCRQGGHRQPGPVRTAPGAGPPP